MYGWSSEVVKRAKGYGSRRVTKSGLALLTKTEVNLGADEYCTVTSLRKSEVAGLKDPDSAYAPTRIEIDHDRALLVNGGDDASFGHSPGAKSRRASSPFHQRQVDDERAVIRNAVRQRRPVAPFQDSSLACWET